MKIRIAWDMADDPTVAVLHCDRELFSWSSQPVVLTALFGRGASELTQDQKRLVDDLLSVHGVANVIVARYQIAVQRGGVFGWDEVQPRVEQVLADWAGAEGISRKEEVSKR